MNTVIIGIGGGTGSRKTSLAQGILSEYGEGEVAVIEQDSYYNDLSNLLYEERVIQNYDHPEGGENKIAVDLIRTKINSILK